MGCGRANLISENITKLLNEQINKEFYSAYLYLSMSAYFCKIGLYGFAHWTKIQAKEEVDHGIILFEYILTQDSTVELKQIEMKISKAADGDFRHVPRFRFFQKRHAVF